MKISFIFAWLMGAIVLSCTHVFAVMEEGSCKKTTITPVKAVDIESFKFLGFNDVNGEKIQCTTAENLPQLEKAPYGSNAIKKMALLKSVTLTRTGVDAQGKPTYQATVEDMPFGMVLKEYNMRCSPVVPLDVGWVILETCQLTYGLGFSTTTWIIFGGGGFVFGIAVLACFNSCGKRDDSHAKLLDP